MFYFILNIVFSKMKSIIIIALGVLLATFQAESNGLYKNILLDFIQNISL